MKPPLFDYQAPTSLDQAIALLDADPGAMVLAGGQSLVPAMNMRLANPTRLVDLQGIPGLATISVADNAVTVGPMVRHRDLELHDGAHRANPLLREALAHVAHVPIRHRGTIVGSLCHADAAAELPMVLVLTGGSVTARGKAGTRTIAAADLFQFHMTTTREPGEIVVEARFPALPSGAGHAFEEFTRRHGDYAIAAVGAIVTKGAGGVIADVSLAACGVSSRPLRLGPAEAVLRGRAPDKAALAAAGAAVASLVTAPDDMHATTAYRRHLLSVLIGRAVVKALARAA